MTPCCTADLVIAGLCTFTLAYASKVNQFLDMGYNRKRAAALAGEEADYSKARSTNMQ